MDFVVAVAYMVIDIVFFVFFTKKGVILLFIWMLHENGVTVTDSSLIFCPLDIVFVVVLIRIVIYNEWEGGGRLGLPQYKSINLLIVTYAFMNYFLYYRFAWV